MGFCGKLWAGVKSVAKGVAETTVAAVEKAGEIICDVATIGVVATTIKTTIEAVEYTRDKVSGMYATFSDKKTFDEADRLYNEMKDKYETAKEQYKSDFTKYSQAIATHIETINNAKNLIKFELFAEFADKMKRIQGVDIDKKFPLEKFIPEIKEFEKVRSTKELYLIDFNNEAFKSHCMAIFTLGFWSRKKAKETLHKVQEESKKVELEIAKMRIETKRISLIEKSLSNIAHYFSELVVLYRILLLRLGSSLGFLEVRFYNAKLLRLSRQDSALNLHNLPLMQQQEIEAIMTLSSILRDMVEKEITQKAIENIDEIVEIKGNLEKGKNLFKEHFEAA
ncbi:hypothetical protein CCY99_06930 [Helicobacter sp. 16-1353]|uniref:hypothetical protein n=1 Tax=Helicobacter sp. 16-1353 TaxID=2004996 RepID=UPI000DCC81D3|nr:hypothetical protein [Helicobacter sp. 16-1353]RAX52697.1 hypothetical protein CCY99_06930 [Helicobacter sp. 16-1353]